MMRLRYTARFQPEEDGWVVEIPDVGHPGVGTWTQGDTLEEARSMASDAVTQMLLYRTEKDQPLDSPTGELPGGWEWVYPNIRVEMAVAIRQERKKVGLTMQQAADRIGVALGVYQRWEDPKKCNATLATLEKVARAFGKVLDVSFR